jgi:urease accessory protein
MQIRSRISYVSAFAAVVLVLGSGTAQAQPGLPYHTHGFVNGLAHPLSGWDHVCAMVAVGLWAAQLGGRQRWVIPSVFVAVMALGGGLGMAGLSVPFIEPGIAASVLILGILIAAAVRFPLAVVVPLVGLFALYHGVAHGQETPVTASGLVYAAGFVIATAFLHLGGLGAGTTMQKTSRAKHLRYAGGIIAVCGLYLIFTV